MAGLVSFAMYIEIQSCPGKYDDGTACYTAAVASSAASLASHSPYKR